MTTHINEAISEGRMAMMKAPDLCQYGAEWLGKHFDEEGASESNLRVGGCFYMVSDWDAAIKWYEAFVDRGENAGFRAERGNQIEIARDALHELYGKTNHADKREILNRRMKDWGLSAP